MLLCFSQRLARAGNTQRPVFGGRAAAISLIALTLAMLSACGPGRQKEGELRGDAVAHAFKEKCKVAGEQILRKPTGVVEGLFFQRDGGEHYDHIKDSQYNGAGGGTLAEPLVNSGLLKFAESPNNLYLTEEDKSFKYRRRGFMDPNGRPVNDIQSEYGYFYKYVTSDDERRRGLLGSELSIRDLRSGELLARTTYFVNQGHRRFCGAPTNGHFHTTHFIIKALDLSKRYPSAWDKQSGERK